MAEIYDVIIIGAGPAGLAASYVLKNLNKNYLILEKGKDLLERNADESHDIPTGFGGCGLFSDGKLSFPPSASKLWTSLDVKKLKESYSIFKEIFDNINHNIPPWDNLWTNPDNYTFNRIKNYDSIILNNFSRNQLLNNFHEININNIVLNCTVKQIININKFYEISTSDNTYLSKNIIIATGKFGTEILKSIEELNRNDFFNKLEVGVRFETYSEWFKPFNSQSMDYKLIEHIEDDVQFRTFCCCKNGVVVKSSFDNYTSFNGAKTQFSTKMSNIGLLIRATDSDNEYYKELLNNLSVGIQSFKISLDDFFNIKNPYIGPKCDTFIKKQLQEFIDLDAEKMKQSFIYGPEIEYIGEYLNLRDNLRVNNNIWYAGDITGEFRGLTAAFISGIYCAIDLDKIESHKLQSNINTLGIKVSKTENMDIIFTAQSKKYFYCKDVICEFVLKREKLPINPFMIFGYFLNDRVNRDIIRQGNNQLIQSCKELWVFGPIADGVLFEIALAKSYGKSIRFFSLGTYLNEIDEIDINNIIFEPEVHAKKIKKGDLIEFIKDNNYDDNQLSLF